MTPEQIALVQSSFTRILPIADAAAVLFYERLFSLDPSLRPMFRGDMAEQGRKLMTMVQLVVNDLASPEKLLPAVRALGRRHAGYGVTPEHYETVGSALLWALEHGLGEAFTPAVALAWAAAYGMLAGAMMEAAEPAQVAA